MSSHNRAVANGLGQPLRLGGKSVRQTLFALVNLPRCRRNRRRLRAFERNERDYAILNDSAHNFSSLHYYITRDQQETQLRAHSFEHIASSSWNASTGHTAAQSLYLQFTHGSATM